MAYTKKKKCASCGPRKTIHHRRTKRPQTKKRLPKGGKFPFKKAAPFLPMGAPVTSERLPKGGKFSFKRLMRKIKKPVDAWFKIADKVNREVVKHEAGPLGAFIP